MYEENNCRNRIWTYRNIDGVMYFFDGKHEYGKYNRVEYEIGQILANSI